MSISNGWYHAVTSLYDVMDPVKRVEAMGLVARKELEIAVVPNELEQDDEAEEEIYESDHEENEEKDELDLAKTINN